MKRKVQAQRKFAQGAYIPPNNNPTINNSACADRKTEHGAQKDSQDQINKNIICTKTSASNLLDVVCFQKLHKHVDPTIFLEQLKQSPPIPKAQAEPLQRKTLSSKATLAKRLFRYLSTSKTFKKGYGMRLRSGATFLKSPIGVSRKDVQKKREQLFPKKNTVKVRRSHFCTEDDKPLTFFTKKKKNPRFFARSEETATTSKNVSNATTSTDEAANVAPTIKNSTKRVAFAKKNDANSPIVLLKCLDYRAAIEALATNNSIAETSCPSTSNTRDDTSSVGLPKQTRRKKIATGAVLKKSRSPTVGTSKPSRQPSTRPSRYAASKRRTSRDSSISPPRTRKKKRKPLGSKRRPLSNSPSISPLRTRRSLATTLATEKQRSPAPSPQSVLSTPYSKPGPKSEKLKRALRQQQLKISAGTSSGTLTPSLSESPLRSRRQTSADPVGGTGTATQNESKLRPIRDIIRYETESNCPTTPNFSEPISSAQEEEQSELDPVSDRESSPVLKVEIEEGLPLEEILRVVFPSQSPSELETMEARPEASARNQIAETPTESPPWPSGSNTGFTVTDIAGNTIPSLPECQVKLVKTTPEKINQYGRAALAGPSQQPALETPDEYIAEPRDLTGDDYPSICINDVYTLVSPKPVPSELDFSIQNYSAFLEAQQSSDTESILDIRGPPSVRATLQAPSDGDHVPVMDVAGPSGVRTTLRAPSDGGLVPGNELTLQEPAPGKSPTLYSINEIERWINDSKKYTSNKNDTVMHFDAVPIEVKYEPQMKTVKINGTWTNFKNYSNSESGSVTSVKSERVSPTQPCPALSYKTLDQLTNASLRDLLRRCKQCVGCYRVDKVLCIGYLFQQRVASVLLQRRGRPGFPVDSDTSDDSDVIIDEPPRPPSRRFRYKKNTNPNNMITAPNGDLLKNFSSQTFYIDIAKASSYLLEFNWNWVESKKKYIVSAGICRRTKRAEITELHLYKHINVLKELFMFMNKFFIGEHMEPIISVPEDFYFQNIADVTSVSDVIDRTIARYLSVTWPKSAANSALRSLMSSGYHGLGPSSAPMNETASSSQPCGNQAKKRSAHKAEHGQHSTSLLTTQKKPDVLFFRFPRESPKQRASPGDTKQSCTNDHSNYKAQKEHGESTTPKEIEGREASSEKTKGTNPNQKEKDRKVIEAPVYHPTEEEFQDPILYFKKITPEAAKYGLCKVVAPKWFKPKCTLNSEMRFSVTNQYICRLYNRWGPASREMCAIKSYLATQSVFFLRPPLLEGIEVNLPKLYQIVQRLGGLKQVIEKKRWTKVAEEMRLMRTPKADKKIDEIYVKYLLPYDTLLHEERLELMRELERYWADRSKKMLERARNPLHRKKRLLGESDSSEDEDGTDSHIVDALSEAEDCFVNGRVMTLGTFKKVAKKVMDTYFGSNKSPKKVEKCYWNLVLMAQDHLCVNTASIDTGEEGYGFPKSTRDPFGKHPWNLKVLSQNSGNVLRCLGPVLGVTVPTLHLGMVFSTSCWHRDPHGLPWMEYLHNGPSKIWYGIPESESANFRRAAEALCPALCQNKLIWLPSDIAMIPPHLLLQRGVALSRLVQRPGEFVIVFPKSYSCSLSTGYTESESVYFATDAWLDSVHEVFHEVRESCEPTMFSLEKLVVLAAREPRLPLAQLRRVYALLKHIIQDEIDHRATIAAFDVKCEYSQPNHRQRPSRTWNIREQEECEVCRTTLYLSRVRGLIEKSSVCPQHALQLLKARKRGGSHPAAEIQIFFKEGELREILRNVENRLADT